MTPIVFFSYLLTPIVKLMFFPKITGKQNYPKDGPVIVCVNHMSNFDVTVLSTTYQKPFRYLAKSSLLKVPLLGPILKWFKIIPVDRDSKDVASLRSAINAAKGGEPIAIFPQGTRFRGTPPQPDQAKKGVALMIASSNATVLPIGLYTKDYKARIFRRYYVNVGAPITPDEYRPILENGDKATRFERLTEYVFGKVCDLAQSQQG